MMPQNYKTKTLFYMLSCFISYHVILHCVVYIRTFTHFLILSRSYSIVSGSLTICIRLHEHILDIFIVCARRAEGNTSDHYESQMPTDPAALPPCNPSPPHATCFFYTLSLSVIFITPFNILIFSQIKRSSLYIAVNFSTNCNRFAGLVVKCFQY